MHAHIFAREYTTYVCIVCGESSTVIAAREARDDSAHDEEVMASVAAHEVDVMRTDSFDDYDDTEHVFASEVANPARHPQW